MIQKRADWWRCVSDASVDRRERLSRQGGEEGHFPLFCRVVREPALGAIIHQWGMSLVRGPVFQLHVFWEGQQLSFPRTTLPGAFAPTAPLGVQLMERSCNPQMKKHREHWIPTKPSCDRTPPCFQMGSRVRNAHGQPTPVLDTLLRAAFAGPRQLQLVCTVAICVAPTHSFFICYTLYHRRKMEKLEKYYESISLCEVEPSLAKGHRLQNT